MSSLKTNFVMTMAVSFFGIVLIELICFLPIMSKVGFYLDDWATLAYMYFGPKEHGAFGLMRYYLLNDLLVVIRPVEALHFGLVYWNFNLNPFPWHVVNMVLEIAVAALSCQIVRKLSGSAYIGFFAAVFILLCPTHDSSHYWVVCSSVTLSLALYLGSLLCTLEAIAAARSLRRAAFHIFSSMLFALSLFNYEMFMPLAAVSVIVSILMSLNGQRRSASERTKTISLKNLQSAVFASTPTFGAMIVPIALLLSYLKLVVPVISTASMRSINFDTHVFVSTVWQGFQLNTPVSFCTFLVSRALEGFDGISRGELVRMLVIFVATVLVFSWLKHQELKSPNGGVLDSFVLSGSQLILLGLFTVAVAYTIFGLCPDYPPTFMTIFNRINTGASFGLALVISGIFSYWTTREAGGAFTSFRFVSLAVFAGVMASVFTLADFGLSKPWIASWNTQKHIQSKILEHASSLDAGASLLLLNCPRYVMWAPVYDGVWDFQNTVRILLSREKFNANVVSERLSVFPGGVKDVSRGTECGAYSFSSLHLLVAPDCLPIRASSSQQFIDCVEHKGMGFGLQPEAVARWKVEAGGVR